MGEGQGCRTSRMLVDASRRSSSPTLLHPIPLGAAVSVTWAELHASLVHRVEL